MHERKAALDQIVSRYNLNSHPFYKDWVAGTLPPLKLRSYAAEYGHFIGTIAEGWEHLGRLDIAEDERKHEVLWNKFREALCSGDEMREEATEELVDAARSAFSKKESALGGLYAFEAQQPVTSASKLHGLNAHYPISESGKEYFEVHAGDFDEVDILVQGLSELDAEGFGMAKTACESVCRRMWSSLDAMYATPA